MKKNLTSITGLAMLRRNLPTKKSLVCNSPIATIAGKLLTHIFGVILAGAFLFSPNGAYAQTRAKKVLGTFVYLGTAYNYEFKKNDISNYSFTISSLTATTKAVTPATTSADTTVTISIDSTATAINTDSTSVDTTSKDTSKKNSVDANANKKTNTDYVFDEFTRDVFSNIFCTQLHEKYEAVNNDALKKKSLEIFFNIQAKLEFLDDEPVTAHMILKKDNINSYLISNTSVYYDSSLSDIRVEHKIKDVNIETEDGAIKNIIVYLVDPKINTNKKTASRGALEFKNAFPITISNKHDPEHFSDIKLYSYNCGGISGLNRYIRLADLLELDITLANDKEDYSPANTTFSLNAEKSIAELRKEKRSQILSVAAFADFVGLDQEQPNGLVQIEAKRKINLSTKYKPIHPSETEDIASNYDLSKYNFRRVPTPKDGREIPDKIKYDIISKDSVLVSTRLIINGKTIGRRDTNGMFTAPKKLLDKLNKENKNKISYDEYIVETRAFTNDRFRSGYYVLFAAIEPKLLFAKLEGNNKFAVLNSEQSASKHTDPLSMYQHQLVSFGINFTTLKLSYPQSKLSWNLLDLGAFWYRSRVQQITDTATQNSVAINNGYLSATSTLNFKPDSRWGANIGATYFKQKSFNNEYKFERKNAGLIQANFDAFIKTNDESKIFFRFRWIFDEHNPSKNFTQVQLGYTLNIFANGSTSK